MDTRRGLTPISFSDLHGIVGGQQWTDQGHENYKEQE
jgi:hypothetical protein